jgi:hypothetical protein
LFLNQLALIKALLRVGSLQYLVLKISLDDFFNDLIETYIGKSCDPYYTNNYMSESEYKEGMNFVKITSFIYPDKDFKIQTILIRQILGKKKLLEVL